MIEELCERLLRSIISRIQLNIELQKVGRDLF